MDDFGIIIIFFVILVGIAIIMIIVGAVGGAVVGSSIRSKYRPFLEKTKQKYNKLISELPSGKHREDIELAAHDYFKEENFWKTMDKKALESLKKHNLEYLDKKIEDFNVYEADKDSILSLLKKLGTKIPASDIDGHLDYRNVDRIKELCEELYFDGKIQRTGNYRYYILKK
tara:strand:+ start:134 stop:649 length:516 start_codon:yes stop_codon:yes gene_type:complete